MTPCAASPAYLQQLQMESNGKSVTLDGKPVEWQTAAVIWGEPGNNGQHSFFQLLHQGTPRAALDFLLPARSSCGNQAQQNLAIASCLAQAEAFMTGQSAETVRAELKRQEMPPAQLEPLIPHKVHPGSRPSTIVLFQKLDPATLGKLIALYEHSVVHAERRLGHQCLRPVGCRAGEETHRTTRTGSAGSGRRPRGARFRHEAARDRGEMGGGERLARRPVCRRPPPLRAT